MVELATSDVTMDTSADDAAQDEKLAVEDVGTSSKTDEICEPCADDVGAANVIDEITGYVDEVKSMDDAMSDKVVEAIVTT